MRYRILLLARVSICFTVLAFSQDVLKIHLSSPLITSENTPVSLENLSLARLLPTRLRAIFLNVSVENGIIYIPDSIFLNLYVGRSSNCTGYVHSCYNTLNLYGSLDKINKSFKTIILEPNLHFNTFKRKRMFLNVSVYMRNYLGELTQLTTSFFLLSVRPVNTVIRYMYKNMELYNTTIKEPIYTGKQRELVSMNALTIFDPDLQAQHLRNSLVFLIVLCDDNHGIIEVDSHTYASVKYDELYTETWPDKNWVLHYLRSEYPLMQFSKKRITYIYGSDDDVNDALKNIYFKPHAEFIGKTRVTFIAHDIGDESGGHDTFNHVQFTIRIRDAYIVPDITSKEYHLFDIFSGRLVLSDLRLIKTNFISLTRNFSLTISTSFGYFEPLPKRLNYFVLHQSNSSIAMIGNIYQLNSVLSSLVLRCNISVIYQEKKLFFANTFFTTEHFITVKLENVIYRRTTSSKEQIIELILKPPAFKRMPLLEEFPGLDKSYFAKRFHCQYNTMLELNHDCSIQPKIKTQVLRQNESYAWNLFSIVSYDQIPPFISSFVLRVETENGFFHHRHENFLLPPLVLEGNLLEINKQIKLYKYLAPSTEIGLKGIHFKLLSKSHWPLSFSQFLQYVRRNMRPRIIAEAHKYAIINYEPVELPVQLWDDNPDKYHILTLHLEIDRGYLRYSDFTAISRTVINNVIVLKHCCSSLNFTVISVNGSLPSLQKYVKLLHLWPDQGSVSSRLDISLYDNEINWNSELTYINEDNIGLYDNLSLYFYSEKV